MFWLNLILAIITIICLIWTVVGFIIRYDEEGFDEEDKIRHNDLILVTSMLLIYFFFFK